MLERKIRKIQLGWGQLVNKRKIDDLEGIDHLVYSKTAFRIFSKRVTDSL